MIRLAIIFLAAALLAGCSNWPENEPQTNEAPQAKQTGEMCGGIAGFRCVGEADYCAMPSGQCGEIADAAGVCTVKPQICTREYRPVCGCDGKTYGNACGAAAAGTSVQYQGRCEGEGN